ncbi:DUF3299 domain-containing protein [Thalassolituus sp. LLYu03]|uniref:DUF3299 domain-containing protein n=1 Tax=Thalassolituus sp. LLYu03 TaxID=3421656 RepID=UPI003D2BAD07
MLSFTLFPARSDVRPHLTLSGRAHYGRRWHHAKALLTALAMLTAVQVQAADYREIEFAKLLPDADFRALSTPPEALQNVQEGSEEDQIEAGFGGDGKAAPDQTKIPAAETDWDRALKSTHVRAEFNQQKIRIAGFVVPIEFDDNQVVTEFFLVPYYGACIHLPPPPPNQLILMQSKKGVFMENIYDPFWIEGTLYTDLKTNDIATSAYRMTVDRIEPYTDSGE